MSLPYCSIVGQGIQSLESISKFACRVCVKQWDLDYISMLQLLLDIPPLSTRRNLTTMHNMWLTTLPISLYNMIFLIVLTIMQILLDLLLNISIHLLYQV